jgi:hypothetical protein
MDNNNSLVPGRLAGLEMPGITRLEEKPMPRTLLLALIATAMTTRRPGVAANSIKQPDNIRKLPFNRRRNDEGHPDPVASDVPTVAH